MFSSGALHGLVVSGSADGARSAVLASFLLKEELGHLGRLGCTLCLLGSLIIVLHAPEDKPVETVDEILHYAIQPGTCSRRYAPLLAYTPTCARFPHVLLHRPRLRVGDDLRRVTAVRPVESARVHLHLLARRLGVGDGDQGLRHRRQADVRGEEPVLAPQHVRVRDRRRRLHPRPNELLQQSAGYVLHQRVCAHDSLVMSSLD